MPPSSITILGIHPQQMVAREERFRKTLEALMTALKSMTLEPTINIVPEVKPPIILAGEVQNRMTKEPYGYELIDNEIIGKSISVEAISNYISHEVGLNFFLEKNKSSGENDFLLVIEDDAVIIDPANLTTKLKAFFEDSSWDMLFLGSNFIDSQDAHASSSGMARLSEKPLVSKECFLVRAPFIPTLLEEMKKMRSTYRILLSYIAQKYKDKVKAVKSAITLDGSKYGYYPSTLYANAPLKLNSDYKKLKELYENPLKGPEDKLAEIKPFIEKFKKNKTYAPEVAYLHGMLMWDAGKKELAHDIWDMALEDKQRNRAIIGHDCNILQAIIRFYKENQTDLPALLATPSKISRMVVA